MTANLQNPIFTDETLAREWLEKRVWPNGPVCPHCGSTGDDVTALNGKAHRPGLYQCSGCREQFTVTVKSVFERSKIPLSKWLAALFLVTASKKGVSAHQIHRSLDISYKSSWFMLHRLREAMRTGGLLPPMGGEGKVVEADETYYGNIPEDQRPKFKSRGGRAFSKYPGGGAQRRKHVIVGLVERGGNVRTFHAPDSKAESVVEIVRKNIAKESTLQTDESKIYVKVGREFAAHETVNHADKEYARPGVTTNTIEGYFSVFKRGMRGVYQHCSEKHLHRYLAEFDFRYNNRSSLGYNDIDRAGKLAASISGKRLTYRRPSKITQQNAL
jgi:transposase-like protein